MSRLANILFRQRNYPQGISTGGPYAKNVKCCVVLGGISVSVKASLGTSRAKMDATENHLIVHGLYVVLPSDMKNFPVDLVPLP